MLSLAATNIKGEKITLPPLESMVLSMALGTPADSLSLMFSFGIYQEICQVFLFDDDILVFQGLVDEQIIYSSQKEKTELILRSLAGRLIDNEAYPRTYINPDTELIFRQYLYPLGITSYQGGNKVFSGEFKVHKGISCWQVLDNFCSPLYPCAPRIEGSVLKLSHKENQGELVFSNCGGIPYEKAEYAKLRCKPLSRIRVKTGDRGDYCSFVEDKDAQNRGIIRERFLNASYGSGTTVKRADELLSAARQRSETVTLYCPQRLVNVLGCTAKVVLENSRALDGFCVSSIRYTFSGTSETTKLILTKKES